METGTLTFRATNAYTGSTTIGGGTLSFNTGILDHTSGIIFEGGSLQWYGPNNEDISALIGPIDSGQSAILDTNGNSVPFFTGLAGDGGLTKIGDGTLTFRAANAYTGSTTIGGGTLSFDTGTLDHTSGIILRGVRCNGTAPTTRISLL